MQVAEHNWDEQCKECPASKTRIEESGYDREFARFADAALMQSGGYPFERNDFTYEEWMALGVITEVKRSLRGF